MQAVFDVPVAADDGREPGRAGLGGGQRGDRIDGLAGPFLLPAGPAAAHDLDGLGGVREGQPGGHGGDFEGAALIAAVATPAGVMGDWDLPPGQGCELGEQARLVALDGEQVVRAAPGQAGGVATLGVHRVGGADRSGDLNAV